MNLAECWSSVMREAVQEMYVDSMSQAGLNEVRYSVRGLRDMDAILGRDDRLVAKLADAAEKLDVNFAAMIGTPVPAVIGTDYRHWRECARRRRNLPVLTVDTDGMELYDMGEEKAWLALFKKFAGQGKDLRIGSEKTDHVKIGVIGMTPQDVSDLKAAKKIRKVYEKEGKRAICYGMGEGLMK